MNYIVLDTETANGLECPMPYDMGYAIINEKGDVLKKISLIIKDIFLDEMEMMRNCYYAEKLPQYWKEYYNREREMVSLHHAKNMLAKDCKDYDVKAIIAHNARFDYCSCNNIQRWTTSSKYRYFFPYGIPIYDTLKMARQVFYRDDDYRKFCFDNGYVTRHKTPRPKLTAEVIYRYLTNDTSFVERHTGLADVLIEKDIFIECLRRKPDIECSLWADNE